MTTATTIEWTATRLPDGRVIPGHTVNPWIGCDRVSPACTNCYAEAIDDRFKYGGQTNWGRNAPRFIRVDKAIGELESIARRSARDGFLHRVFIASMSDVFEDRPDLIEPRKRIWDALHRLDGRLIPMVLTKRPELMAAWAKEHGWPAGAWAGTTVEDQRRADERIPSLLRVPAGVRFLSMEPLLGPVNLAKVRVESIGPVLCAGTWDAHKAAEYDGVGGTARVLDGIVTPDGASETGWLGGMSFIDWVIVGGESGPKARPMHPAWARSLRDQAQAAGVAFHFKQWGEWAPGEEVEANRTDWPGMYEHSREDGGAPRHSWPDAEIRETAKRLGRDFPAGPIDMDTTVLRVGKHAAGRLLDGRAWDGLPE